MRVVKIRKLMLSAIVFLFLVSIAQAADVCVVVYYPDNTADTECVTVDDGASGYEVMEATSFNLLWSDESMYGRMLCRINGIGDDTQGQYCGYTGSFWNFNLAEDGEWKHMPVGLDGGDECWNRDFSWSDWATIVHYCAQDNDIISFVYGEGGDVPEMLSIKEIKAYVDGDKVSGADETGGTIDNVKPESTVKLKIKLENLYSRESKIGIDNIEVTGTIEEIDDGDDIEEEEDGIDIDAENDETVELVFEIPLEVEDESFDLILSIGGEDDYGVVYSKEIDFTVKVEKDKHNLKFQRFELGNEEIKCGSSTELLVSIANIGSKDEDAELTIASPGLGINRKETFKLENDPFDDDSKFTKTYLITPEQDGNYIIEAKLVYGSEEETATAELKVDGCEEAIQETKTTIEGSDEEKKITETVVESMPTSAVIVQPAGKEESFFEGKGYTLMVVIAYIAVIAIGAAALIKLAKR